MAVEIRSSEVRNDANRAFGIDVEACADWRHLSSLCLEWIGNVERGWPAAWDALPTLLKLLHRDGYRSLVWNSTTTEQETLGRTLGLILELDEAMPEFYLASAHYPGGCCLVYTWLAYEGTEAVLHKLRGAWFPTWTNINFALIRTESWDDFLRFDFEQPITELFDQSFIFGWFDQDMDFVNILCRRQDVDEVSAAMVRALDPYDDDED